jgi:triosephosphate isomerase
MPVVCVGEKIEARAAGCTNAVIGAQLQTVLEQLTADQAAQIIVAYEPVWAIGTGQSATVEQAQSAHAFLRAVLAAKTSAAAQVPVLYGGSVNAANAVALFRSADIDGGLIGGASLRADDFLSVCAAADVAVRDDRAIR